MKLSTTIACDSSGDVIKLFRMCYEAGFRNFDVPICPLSYGGWSSILEDGEGWKRDVEKIGNLQAELGFNMCQAHSAMLDIYASEEKRNIVNRAILRSFEACEMLNIPMTVVHGINFWKEANNPDIEKFYKCNREFYLPLCEEAAKHNVEVLTENFGRDCKGYFATTGKLIADFLDYCGADNLFVCWDTGHANICSDENTNQYEDIMAIGDRLHALHIHDGWGNQDCHAIPFSGTVNFDRVIRALIDTGYKGTFNFEASDTFINSGDYRRKRRAIAPGERLADPPMFIFGKYFELLFEMGKWMLSEYNLYED